MLAPRLEFNDKTQAAGYDPAKLNASEINDVKAAINGHADLLDGLRGSAIPTGIPAFRFDEYYIPAGSAGQRVYGERIWQPKNGVLSVTPPAQMFEPSDEADSKWKEVSGAIATVLFQRLGRLLLLELRDNGELATGRQYEIVRPGGNVYASTLGDSGQLLSPAALWANPATPGRLEQTNYNLDTDTVTPNPAAVVYPAAGGVPQFFATAQAGHDAASDGDRLSVRGHQPGVTTITKSLSIDATGATLGSLRLGYQASGLTIRLTGGTYLEQLGLFRSYGTDVHDIDVQGVTVPDGGLLDLYALLTPNSTNRGRITVRNSRVSYVRNQQRDNDQQQMAAYFKSCVLGGGSTDVFGGYANAETIISAHDCTFIVPAGKALWNVVGVAVVAPIAVHLALQGQTNVALPNAQPNAREGDLLLTPYADPFYLAGSAPVLPKPAGPTWDFNDETRTWVLAAPTGYESAALEYSYLNGAYTAYATSLSADNDAHPAGDWKGRVKAVAGQWQAGEVAFSRAIAAATSGGFTKPAPTLLIVDDVRNTLTFTHEPGVFASQGKFRYRVNGGPLKMLTAIREPNNTQTTFLVGNINAAIGAVEVCEVNTSGVQISPFASTSQAYTSGVLQAGLLLESDSIFYNAGMLSDANLETAITSQETELTRMEALLDASGVNWNYRVFAFPNRRASEINSADSLNNINTLGPTYLGQVPNMIFHSGEWINERRAGTSKEQVYEINKATFLAVRATGKYQNLVISGPTDANIEAVVDGESWETCVDYWTTRLRSEWPTFADAFVDFSTCPYVGVGTNVEKGLINGIYGDTLHQATPGRLVIISRVLAAVLALNGQLVFNDLGTPTLQIVNNTITTIHSSKSAVETSVDNGATWHITPICDLLDQTGTARIRLVADPSTEVQVPFAIASGFEPESVAYAASARALGSYFIRPEKYNPAIALLKATERLSDVALLAHGGGGVVYSPGTLRLAKWKALIGPDLFPPLPENAPTFTEAADNGRGAVNWQVGYQPHLVATLANIPAPYAVLMRVEVTTPSYSGIASINKEKLCVISNGGLVNLSNNVTNSPKTDLPMTGYHNVIVRVDDNSASLMVDGTDRVNLSTVTGPLNHLALSAILDAAGANGLSLTGATQNVCVVRGIWTDAELNTLAIAL